MCSWFFGKTSNNRFLHENYKFFKVFEITTTHSSLILIFFKQLESRQMNSNITTQHWFRLGWGGYLKKFRIKEAPVLGIKIISQSNNHRVWVFWQKKKQIQRTVSFRYFKNVYEPPSFMKEPTNDLVVLGRCLIFSKELRTVIIYNKWVFDFS